jgi:hypothetical protein
MVVGILLLGRLKIVKIAMCFGWRSWRFLAKNEGAARNRMG